MELNPIPMRLAVVTGGHAFDVPNFHRLFRRLKDVDAYVQTMDDFAASPQETRDQYDAVLFYHMLKETPLSQGQSGSNGKTLAALERLRECGQGLVVLHHALLAYPEWPGWRKISGIDPALESYQHDQKLAVRVVDSDHPITAGLSDFELVDETYQMHEPDPGNRLLLATHHPGSLTSLAWVRHYGESKVFCLALGHDNQAWSQVEFETLLQRGIAWVAGR